MTLRKESKRGLVALAVLCAAAVVTFAITSTLSSKVSSQFSSQFPWGARRSHGRDAVAERLAHAR